METRSPTGAFGRLSLSTKGVLVVAIPLSALAIAIALFHEFESRVSEAQGWVQHTVEVRGEIRQVMLSMAQAESAVRGYLLTRRDDLLAPYTQSREEVPRSLERLRFLLRNNAKQTAELARVNASVPATFRALEQLRLPPDSPAEVQAADNVIKALDAELSAMLAEEERLLTVRTAEAQRAARLLRVSVFVGGGAGLLGGILGALVFMAGIVRRVREVEHGARLVAAGQRIETEAAGGDEISRLQRTLKRTSELLTAQAEQLRAAREELEDRVARRTSELQAANEALREANEVRQAVIQYSPLAIWAIDLEGRVTFWNHAAERIFGWSEQEVLWRPLPAVPAELKEEYQAWLERFREGKSWSGMQSVRVRKDGTRVEVAVWTAPLRDATGRITGTISIDSDITERKLLEEQFRQSQKLEAVGRLAGGVAHDFNNLLTVIAGYTEMIIAEAQDLPNLVDYAQEVQYAGTRAAALTAQLLAFSRRQITQPRIVDLNELVQHSAKLLRRVIGEDVEIFTNLSPDLDRIKADPTHIDQVIMNLVVNARDAMSKGGRLTIDTSNTWLDQEYAGRHIGVKPGKYVMLAVSDTGHGMTPEVRTRLFEPFFTTKPAGKGTGLGLSIVYGIVKQNYGEIMVYSEPGKGTTFKIYFPVAAAAAESSQAEGTPEDVRGSETVLMCEDEEHIRKLVTAVLTKLGYRVLETDHPDAALALARDFPEKIDLLLTDIVMPQGNGFELARTVRRARPDIAVLYMSGYTDNHLSGNWVLEPDMPFLQKPFAVSVLARKVREALARGARAA